MRTRTPVSSSPIARWRLLIAGLGLSMALAACGRSADPAAQLDPNVPPVTGGSWYQPAVSVSWQWQLSGTINESYAVDIYDIDLFDVDIAVIQSLQSAGKKVLCYFSAGSSENWRPDYASFNDTDLGDALDGWPGERWLDVRSTNVHNIMKARLDLAVSKGCDGVEPDNMDGWANDTTHGMTATDQLAYNRWLGNEAHNRNLGVALKNDLDQIAQLVDYYDLQVNEECFEFSECDALALFINAGKPVLSAEYKQLWVENATERNTMCADSLSRQFSTLVLPLLLDDSFRYSCL